MDMAIRVEGVSEYLKSLERLSADIDISSQQLLYAYAAADGGIEGTIYEAVAGPVSQAILTVSYICEKLQKVHDFIGHLSSVAEQYAALEY